MPVDPVSAEIAPVEPVPSDLIEAPLPPMILFGISSDMIFVFVVGVVSHNASVTIAMSVVDLNFHSRMSFCDA